MSWLRKPPKAEDEPWRFGEARGGGPGRPSSYIRPQARCRGLAPRPPSLELRSVPAAAAMKCLVLALSVALVCGTQAIFVPRTVPEDLDVQKVWGQRMLCRGTTAGGGELQVDRKLGPQNTEGPVMSGVCERSLGRP